ncbi:hypothetical protein Ccrd_018710 [Cynara cardunculus var. scolymus]|uniref:Uncharacterized protein n=1 Tax=Cynara cardunculus var. scolymus TaxID=59895 RepID=A0A103Y5Q7_CYNCS|nr:hypothetical protein Ccrd_018710 [Cynara cardunculus var. scolymus]
METRRASPTGEAKNSINQETVEDNFFLFGGWKNRSQGGIESTTRRRRKEGNLYAKDQNTNNIGMCNYDSVMINLLNFDNSNYVPEFSKRV